MSEAGVSVSAAARRLVEARRAGASLSAYPGAPPPSLAVAYAIQDEAIALWPDEIAGWKIGLIQPPYRAAFGAERIAGPIFGEDVRVATADAVIDLPAFEGGFAAIEAEFVFRLGAHAPADKYDWTNAEAAELIGALHVGIESAGSPFAEINDHGPAVTASDFGNNAGLIVGPAIDWRADAFERLTAETFIDGVSVGRGDASLIHGSPLAALAFVLGETAARGMPLRAGQWISTGAVTGVHPIHIGQSARAVFGAGLALNCRVVRAGPRQSPQASTRRTSL